jgi:hypothetical protein
MLLATLLLIYLANAYNPIEAQPTTPVLKLKRIIPPFAEKEKLNPCPNTTTDYDTD